MPVDQIFDPTPPLPLPLSCNRHRSGSRHASSGAYWNECILQALGTIFSLQSLLKVTQCFAYFEGCRRSREVVEQ